MWMFGWFLGCTGAAEIADCEEATLLLDAIAEDPKGMAGAQGIACGAVFEARSDGISNECGDTGLGDPVVMEGTYAVWPSDWGLERRGYSVGVVVLDQDGVTEIGGLPEATPGELIAVQATIRYDQVHDLCSNSLFGSAYLEVSASEVGLD